MRVAVLSVHYRYPELLADQIGRLRRCAGATREELGAELRFHPIVHAGSRPSVKQAVHAGCRASGGFAEPIDLSDRRPPVMPERELMRHGHGLAEAYRVLRRDGRLANGDLVAAMDHDAHPLDDRLFAVLGRRLAAQPDLAGTGIPQWYHGRTYLHPSFLLTRVATVDEMGEEAAFLSRQPAFRGDPDWYDTCEGFTIWCERHRRTILPLRVVSTAFPFDRWDSDMAPGGGTELTGWHGEPVRIGHLMRFGLEADRPLVSHVWASFLGPWRQDRFSPSSLTWEEALAAYLAELPIQDRTL
jgi:hypothetical protein